MTSQEVDALNTMFGIIESIRQGTGRDVTRLMGVFTNVAGYDPHNNFDKAQEKISKIMRAKFQKIDLHEIIPLPQFNINNDIFHQSKQFDDAFDIFAQHLIQQIDESLQTSILDADSACEIFNALIKRTSKEDLTEVVRNAFKGKKSSETNYSKQVQDIIDNKGEIHPKFN
ncbi:hypothetical protein GPJ56_008075 [Histomonas meleagridis]|nr:hypothetical protein GPJ56_008075 [Histomonas meleagridis]